MLSSPRNPPANTLRPSGSLRLTHQLKLSIKPWNARSRKRRSALPSVRSTLNSEQRRPGVHRWIDVAEVPLVGGNLPARVDVQTAEHQQQLVLGEIEVHHRQRDGVKGKVPRRIPGVFPLVRHGDDVGVEHVKPLAVPHAALNGFQERMTAMLAQPVLQVEVVVLLRPQHARQRLPVHSALILVQGLRCDPLVEFVGLGDPPVESSLEPVEGIVDGARPPDAAGWCGCRRPARRASSGPRPWSPTRPG